MIKRKQVKTELNVNTTDEHVQSDKRGITYQIEKNKGLTVKRKKEYRNPRVRHRNKYARALVKRTSRVPTARNENEKYSGEPTGIRAGLKRGIALKS
jgi:U3 small nucleolar RNA-associated protein 3